VGHHRAGRLPTEQGRLRRYGLSIIDEVGYLPFEQDAANLCFHLVSSRCEHASLILTSNLPSAAGAAPSPTTPSRSRDRPRCPPRRHLHPQRRQLPTTQPRNRHPAQHQNPRHARLRTNRWPRFKRRIGLSVEHCRHRCIQTLLHWRGVAESYRRDALGRVRLRDLINIERLTLPTSGIVLDGMLRGRERGGPRTRGGPRERSRARLNSCPSIGTGLVG